MKKSNKTDQIDPSKPLRNLKHEAFAKALIETKGNQTQAYKSVYPVDHLTAKTNGSVLLSHANVRERVIELMNTNPGTSQEHVVEKLAQGIDSENEGIMMDGVKTALKVYGVFDDHKADVSIGNINVVFGDA